MGGARKAESRSTARTPVKPRARARFRDEHTAWGVHTQRENLTNTATKKETYDYMCWDAVGLPDSCTGEELA